MIGQAIERRAWHLLGVVSVVPGAVGAWHRDAVLAVGGFGTDTLAEDDLAALVTRDSMIGTGLPLAPTAA